MNKMKQNWKNIVLTLLILVLTFPSFNLVSSPGLDSSYTWGLNHLFANDYNTLTQLVYPIGVLGFLKMPLDIGNNLILAIGFIAALRFGLIYLLVSLVKVRSYFFRILTYTLIIYIVKFSGYDITFIGICALLGIEFLSKKKLYTIFLLTGIAYLGVNIKTSIGISCFSILFMTMTLYSIHIKNTKSIFSSLLTSILTIIGLGLLLFGNIQDIITHFAHAVKISSGYSSSLALHPNNNWISLIGFFSTFFIFPFVIKSKRGRQLFLLCLPSLFMMWKHAMVRQDTSHNGILLYFTFVFFGITILLTTSNKFRVIAIGILSLFFFHNNLKTIDGFNGVSFSLNGPQNLANLLSKKYIAEQKQLTTKALKPLILPDSIKSIIGKQTIDFYPWEHNYAQANGLNWFPRKTIEIGASSSQWTSRIASEHYLNSKSPEFVLWHFNKNNFEGNTGTFDNRFILNDEPLVVMNLLQHYSIVSKVDEFILLQKKSHPLTAVDSSLKKKEGKWNEWIEVENSNKIARCKIDIKPRLTHNLLTFLYKDDLYEIDYKLNDGRIISYRFIPNTAKDGLWISPMINTIHTKYWEAKVKRFRIRKVFYPASSGSFNYQIVNTELFENSKFVSPLDKKEIITRTVILEKMQDFETKDSLQWFKSSKNGFKSTQSNLIEKDNFSYTYRFSLDSIWKLVDSNVSKVQIEVSGNAIFKGNNADLIIEVQNSKKDFWVPFPIPNRTNWNYIYTSKTIYREESNTGNLTIYFWNKDTENLIIDNLMIQFSHRE